jgi:O-antigen ligase
VNALTNAASGTARPPRVAARAPRAGPGRRPIMFWLLLVFFVLEYIRPEPFVRLKFQMLYLIVVPIMWLAAAKRPWSRNLTIQAVFLGLCAFSVPWASNNFSAYTVTRILYGYLMIAIAITWLLSNRRDFVFAIWFWVALMAIQAIVGLTTGGHGYGSSFEDENDLALGLNTAVPFVIGGIQIFRGWRRFACVALLVLLLSGIVASLSRGGFVGLVSVVLFCILTGKNRIRNLAIAVVGSLVFYLGIPANYKGELASIKDTDQGTSEARQFLWIAAFNMWVHNPVFGVGAGNSNWNVGRYQPEATASGKFSDPIYAERDWTMASIHSAHFQILSEMGTVGTAVFVAMMVVHFRGLSALRRHVRRDRRASRALRREAEIYAIALGGAMVGFLASGTFLSVAYYPYAWYFSAFGVAWSRSVQNEIARGSPRPPAPSPDQSVLPVALGASHSS